jgi:hypothetical protein
MYEEFEDTKRGNQKPYIEEDQTTQWPKEKVQKDNKGGVYPFSPKYRLSSIICDVASFRLFKPVRSEPLHESNRKFLHIPFANKGINAINISNILNRKEVVKEIPPYFKNMFPIDVLRFSEFRTMRNHLSETLMLNDIQITSDYMTRWVVLKRRVGAVTSQRVIKVLLVRLG